MKSQIESLHLKMIHRRWSNPSRAFPSTRHLVYLENSKPIQWETIKNWHSRCGREENVFKLHMIFQLRLSCRGSFSTSLYLFITVQKFIAMKFFYFFSFSFCFGSLTFAKSLHAESTNRTSFHQLMKIAFPRIAMPRIRSRTFHSIHFVCCCSFCLCRKIT